MNRTLSSLLGAGAVLAAAAFAPAAASVMIKPHVTIEFAQITLGDVLEGVGEKATAIVGQAPRPGQRTLLPVAYVAQVARANGIAWRGMPPFSHIVVRRAGRLVPQTALEDAVAKALQREGMRGPIDIQFRGTPELHVPTGTAISVAVRDVDYDPTSGQFAVTVQAPADDTSGSAIRAAGQAFTMVKVPVLTRPVSVGSNIHKKDVEWISVRSDRVRGDFAFGQDQLVGMAVKRPVQIGEPIRLSDIEPPVLVAKGANVVMEVTSGPMLLSTSGQAIEAGAKGDTIRLTNPKSKRTVFGIVTGPNRVVVAVNQTVLSADKP